MAGLRARRWVVPGMLAVMSGLAGCAMTPLKEQVVTLSAASRGAGVDVEAHNGEISITRDAGATEVTIVATLRMTSEDRLGLTTIAAGTIEDEKWLRVRAEPPDGKWMGREGVSFVITVPGADGVRAESSNGRIEIAGLSGRADLETSNGRITVTDHDGPVKADTSNGSVKVTGATGPVEVDTSNGSVTVAMAAGARGPVKIETSNGSVALAVGSGFAGALSIDTSNGSVTLPEGLDVRDRGRNSARVAFGDGEKSSVSTSNGSVVVERK